MPHLLSLIIFLVSFTSMSTAIPEKEMMSDCERRSSVVDEKLRKKEAVYEFKCNGLYDLSYSRELRYSIDGNEHNETLGSDLTITVKTTPGKHIFKFYYNENFYEIFTDSLTIKSKYRDTYDLYFSHASEIYEVEKPVIYLYPKETQEVKVNLEVKGDLSFSYPEYADGWSFSADPSGDLHFGSDVYNYLFWESTQQYVPQASTFETGFVVKGSEALTFLDSKLDEAGLSTIEKADFITYWGPRLSENETNFIHFEFNDSCNQFAELDITPKPDNIYRIYMIWSAIESILPTEEQNMKQFNREGFSVLEWGGSEINITKNIEL